MKRLDFYNFFFLNWLFIIVIFADILLQKQWRHCKNSNMSWNYIDNPFNVWPTLNTAGWRFVMVSLVIIICFSLAGKPESGLELDRWFFKEAPFECIWRTSSAGLEWRRSPRFSSLSWLTLQKRFYKVYICVCYINKYK